MTLFKQFIGFLSLVVIATACSQPERITVDEDPEAVASGDTTKAPQGQATFQQLNIGEYSPIRSLDPLFAENASTMRAVQMIYEGLVRFNEEGEVSPGLAYNWEVNDDSSQYNFYLRSEIFYHDSQIFSTGTGRRVTPEDVKFVFERMASMNVPPRAAQLFMNIDGFNPYYQEQRFVYNPHNRQVEGVSGITTPNDSTVTFQLKESDPDFPHKLATPFAVVYPREAVTSSSSITPVGAGPFTFTQVTSDSTLILSKFQDYYLADQVSLNRIDIQVSKSETSQGKSMDNQDLHLLPQLGPQLMVNVVDDNGQLQSEYADQYSLQVSNGKTNYVIRHNPSANLSLSAAQSLVRKFEADTASYFDQYPASLVQPDTSSQSTPANEDTSLQQQEIFTTYAGDPFLQTFLGSLSNNLSQQNVSLQMMNVRAPTERTALFFTTDYPFLPDKQWNNYEKVFSFSVKQVALQQTSIEGLAYNQYPWWIDIRGVTLSPTASF